MFNRNFYTPTETARLAYLESLCIDDLDTQRLVLEYRDYYDGDHETRLTDRQIAFLEDRAGSKFRLNQCPNVVEALVDRLEVSGFEVIAGPEDAPDTDGEGGDAPASAGLSDFAGRLWEENRMDAGQEEIFRQAGIDWLTYVVLDIDAEGKITFCHNDAYTDSKASISTSSGSGEGVKLHYPTDNRRGKPIFATKRWAVTDGPDAGYRRYFTVYYPERIERYYQDDRELAEGRYSEVGWKPLKETEGPLAGVWPQPWVDQAGVPLGIPVVEFRNGRASELSEVTPIQRALNKSFIDLIAAADAAGFRVMFASGWEPVDENGNSLKVEPGSILWTLNKEGTLDSIPGDDLTRLIQVIDRHILSIAQVSRTPISNFQLFGQIPSADSQKQLEAGLLAKCKSRQRVYGNAWEDLIYLARRVALGVPLYGLGESAGRVVSYGLPAYSAMLQGTEGVKLGTLWQETETRNEKAHLETLTLKKALGVPQSQLYLEMGYSQAQADKWAAEAEERRLTMAALVEDQNVGGQDGGQTTGQGQGALTGAGAGGQPNNGNGRGASAG
jgi:SPP1 Gp6-like portal protein